MMWLLIFLLNPRKDKVMPLIIQGFKDAAEEAGNLSVTADSAEPWIVLGVCGYGTVCQPNEFIM